MCVTNEDSGEAVIAQKAKALVEFPWAISIILYIKSGCSRPILEMEHTSTTRAPLTCLKCLKFSSKWLWDHGRAAEKKDGSLSAHFEWQNST